MSAVRSDGTELGVGQRQGGGLPAAAGAAAAAGVATYPGVNELRIADRWASLKPNSCTMCGTMYGMACSRITVPSVRATSSVQRERSGSGRHEARLVSSAAAPPSSSGSGMTNSRSGRGS